MTAYALLLWDLKSTSPSRVTQRRAADAIERLQADRESAERKIMRLEILAHAVFNTSSDPHLVRMAEQFIRKEASA